MPNLNLFKFYAKSGKIGAAVKNPLAALRAVKAISWNIPRSCYLLGIAQRDFNKYIDEIKSNRDFNQHVFSRLKGFKDQLSQEGSVTGAIEAPIAAILYALARSLAPELVLETGVANGLSSAYILLALEANGKGKLYSIDLPCEEGKIYPDGYFNPFGNVGRVPKVRIPKGEQPGWLIPGKLRHRWVLTLGKSSEVLPVILEQLKYIDIFIHDSEHSYENMKLEYQTVWPYLKSCGLLLSHDVGLNEAFAEFCWEHTGSRLSFLPSFAGIVKA